MGECVFCRIAHGEIPSVSIYEDDKIIAFMDINPAAKGHTLVTLKNHYERLSEVPWEELSLLIAAVQKLSKVVSEAAQAPGFNVLLNNGKEAGQVIPHVHFHIIPRKGNDCLDFSWKPGKAGKKELEEFSEIVRAALRP